MLGHYVNKIPIKDALLRIKSVGLMCRSSYLVVYIVSRNKNILILGRLFNIGFTIFFTWC
jgi:hypothetical protein